MDHRVAYVTQVPVSGIHLDERLGFYLMLVIQMRDVVVYAMDYCVAHLTHVPILSMLANFVLIHGLFGRKHPSADVTLGHGASMASAGMGQQTTRLGESGRT